MMATTNQHQHVVLSSSSSSSKRLLWTTAVPAEKPQPSQQILVRFQNQTHVVSIPSDVGVGDVQQEQQQQDWLLSFWSQTSGWPQQYLRIDGGSSWQANFPFCDILVVSSLRGGKGGFGTLLKGQSRQAGAKLTTDFGACRDLQGRRLRHVNDEIKLRKWREMEKRKQAGEKIEEDELWKTPSGIYNWHLMTPTWADISKKATYRIKRQFQKMNKEEQKKIMMKKEQEEAYQKSMTHYLEQATSAVETIQQEIPDAIQQGLAAAAAAAAASASDKKRKRSINTIIMDNNPEHYQHQPNSLCTLSGDAIIVDNSSTDSDKRERKKESSSSSSVQLQSKSDFCTAVLVLDHPTPPSSTTPILYYEVTLVTGGLAQIGWANLVGDADFTPNNDLGDGVGDDTASFAMDGSRGLKFHAGIEESYGEQTKWKEGDRVGCLFHVQQGNISFTLNGKDLGIAFTTTTTTTTPAQQLVPAFSCNQGEILELHITQDDCCYFPDQAVAVRDLVVLEDQEETQISTVAKAKDAPIDKKTGDSQAAKQHLPEPKVTEKKEPVKLEKLDLERFQSVEELEALGLDRLKGALMAIQVKCG